MTRAFLETIDTKRLLLRLYRWDDIDDLMKFATDENWSRYTRPPYPYSRENAQEFLADRAELSRPDQTVWCLEFHNQMIGDVGFAWRLPNRSAEIAYRLSPKFWNQSLITEACNTTIDTAFQHDKALNRIYAAIDTRNAASIKVAKKISMQEEGILRENRLQKGQLVDDAWYAVLREEWAP
jgi:ribosomal-protein-alanine N-acetyltransferase